MTLSSEVRRVSRRSYYKGVAGWREPVGDDSQAVLPASRPPAARGHIGHQTL